MAPGLQRPGLEALLLALRVSRAYFVEIRPTKNCYGLGRTREPLYVGPRRCSGVKRARGGAGDHHHRTNKIANKVDYDAIGP